MEAEEEAGNNDGSGDRWHLEEAHHKRLVGIRGGS